MSKKWKIAIGVIVAAVVISGIGLLRLGSVIYWSSGSERGWSPVAYLSELVWGPGASEYVRKLGWGPAAYKGEARVTSELEVRLLDHDGDGVPDRGVIEVPEGVHPGWGYGPQFGRRFGPSTTLRTGRHFGRGFGPFVIVGGLFRLAFLALLVGLAVAFFRRWSQAKMAGEPQAG